MHRARLTRRLLAACLLALASANAAASTLAGQQLAVAAHPLAAAAARDILGQDGSATDAAVAAALVLAVVEPQSSGLGGGGFLLHWSAAERQVTSYDGRETAPAAARPERFLGPDRKPMSFAEAQAGGLSVGVPGLLRMLELAHRRHGRLAWARLFEPAIRLAEGGFPVAPRLAAAVKGADRLERFGATERQFHAADGTPIEAGDSLRNPPLAATLRQLARLGAEALHAGPLAERIVKTVAEAPVNPGDLTAADLAAYRAVERAPVCGLYRLYRVCGMGPPSSGGLVVLQMLALLERFDLAALAPDGPQAAHLLAEAGRLAYADRLSYLGDADFVAVPLAGLMARDYLSGRSALIDPLRALGLVAPGEPAGRQGRAPAAPEYEHGTTHLSVVDAQGNGVALTASIEGPLGSYLTANGFLLNNQLTDFAFQPLLDGRPVANAVAGGKRPRSTMAPTIVLAPDGTLFAVLGSAGGARIGHYVASALLALIDWRQDPARALGRPHVGNRNGPTELEQGSAAEALVAPLKALGHDLRLVPMASGTHLIQRANGLWLGAADPRRDGAAAGD